MSGNNSLLNRIWRSRLWLPLLMISLTINAYALTAVPETAASGEITLESIRPEARESPVIQDIIKSKLSNPIKRELVKENMHMGNIPKSPNNNYELFVNESDEYCRKGKCLTYIVTYDGEEFNYIATTYVEKDKIRMIDYVFPGMERTVKVNCDVIFEKVCIFNWDNNPGLEGKRHG